MTVQHYLQHASKWERFRLVLGIIILLAVIGLAALLRFEILNSVLDSDTVTRDDIEKVRKELKADILMNRSMIEERGR